MSTHAFVNLIAAVALAAGTGAALAQDKSSAADAKAAAAKKQSAQKAAADKSQPAARQVVPTAAGATAAPGTAEKAGGKHCHDKSVDA